MFYNYFTMHGAKNHKIRHIRSYGYLKVVICSRAGS